MAFKICVVGCGNISISQHAPAIVRYTELHKDAVFIACCDIEKERAAGYRDLFGLLRFYTNIDEMLDTEKPNAVSLTCSDNKTAELSCRIMERGYPIILEKPPGLNSDETGYMIDVAKKSKVPNQVAFNRRYMPVVQKLMEILIELDATNEIMDINYRMLRVNRRDTGFAVTAIHGIDLVRYIAGADYKKVHFQYNELPQYGKSVANFHLDGIMSSGAMVHLDFLPMSSVVTERLEVNTHKGLFWLELPLWGGAYDMPGRITHLIDNEVVFTMSGEEAADSCDEFMINGFYHENKCFFDDIRNGIKPQGDIASGLQAVEIADCINDRRENYG
ncbi:MAG: Gfo/Idh/MocA family oxidoreductase [Oscillospiraceae bacterium]|jgi:predicted dehydrogenase|nr:Gfo/Idh/MocA family oxidoreductase [Oscillospiraceae bacterium]